jgi:hypothetical protein
MLLKKLLFMFASYNPGKAQAQAEWLLRQYNDKEAALEHARWAYREVYKPPTVAFWGKVIKELIKR